MKRIPKQHPFTTYAFVGDSEEATELIEGSRSVLQVSDIEDFEAALRVFKHLEESNDRPVDSKYLITVRAPLLLRTQCIEHEVAFHVFSNRKTKIGKRLTEYIAARFDGMEVYLGVRRYIV